MSRSISPSAERSHVSPLASRLRELVTGASFTTPDWVVTSAWTGHAPFGFWLVEALTPRLVVELGVYQGFSYFTFCQATARYAADARLVGIDSWEGDEQTGAVQPEMRRQAEARNEAYTPRSSLIAATFDSAVERFDDGTIDLLHIDGLHTYDAARHDFETWLPKLSSRAVVLLHDTDVRDRGFGVWRLMDELAATFPTFRFTHDHGLGVVGVGADLPSRVEALFDASGDEALRAAVVEAYELLGSRVCAGMDTTRELRVTGARGTDLMRETLELRARVRAFERYRVAVDSSHSWRITAPLRRAAAWVRRSRHSVRRAILLRVPVDLDARRAFYAIQRRQEWEGGSRAYANWIETYDTLDQDDAVGMEHLAASLTTTPLISVVMPVYNPELHHLRAAIDSLRAQVYANWQLCAADDSSTDPAVREVLESYARRDPRIVLVCREENGGISAAANSALEFASGDVVALLDQSSMLRPHALLLVAQRFAEQSDLGVVYSDEDMIDEEGVRKNPYLKPDWNPELLRSQNYLAQLSSFSTELVRHVGGFRSEYDGSHDWDLALRITALLDERRIAHIPHVLHHRRSSPTAGASGIDAQPYAPAPGRAAVVDHLRRLGVEGTVVSVGAYQNVRYDPPSEHPLVSVVVPTTMRDGLFDQLVDGLVATTYDHLELVRVASCGRIVGSPPLEVAVPPRIRCVDVELADATFNFARAVNLGCAAASGSLVLLVNDDVEILHSDWLEIMVGHIMQPGVGAVGPLLLFPDERVQHAGVLLGAPEERGVAGHLYFGAELSGDSQGGRLRLNQDLSCVTGACMLVRREAFDELGGFDEAFEVSYNDVDFCIRLRMKGWRIVFTPDAMLTHHESASFGSHSEGRADAYRWEVEEMKRRWGHLLRNDPSHNPNLALDPSSPWRLAFPPRARYPWRTGVGREPS